MFVVSGAQAQTQSAEPTSVEIRGDRVDYSVDGNTVEAQGHVEIYYGDTILYSDQAEFSRQTNIARVSGNVRLVTPEGEVSGEKVTFDYNTMQGDLNGAQFILQPYFGAGRAVSKVSDNKYVVFDGHLSTSDFDKPEYRIASKRIEIYPGQKAVARHVRVMIGNVPIFYLPRYTQDLRDRRPRFVLIPGRSKDWGDFLLTRYNHYVNDNLSATVKLDYRVKLGLATGLDIDYNTGKWGEGVLKTYYTHQRQIESEHIWEVFDARDTPAVEKERYKAEWRHRWLIDKKTTAVAQIYKLSDATFLKDFFESEYRRDSNPDTYFLFSRVLPKGTLSFRTDLRANRFETKVERLPEFAYSLPPSEIAESGIYLQSDSVLTNLRRKEGSPSGLRQETVRLNTDNEISYPTKISFLEFRPYVGMENTYYSKTKNSDKDGAVRGQLKTGARLSTKFYRSYDAAVDAWGMHINRLRHIITPSIEYRYTSDPTLKDADLDMYDAIDTRSREHKYVFALENKIQTKRNNKTVELLRVLTDLDYRLKEDPLGEGFNIWSTDVDFRPTDWLTMYFDAQYDTRKDYLDTVNYDAYFKVTDDVSFGVGQRYSRDVDSIMNFALDWKLNPKWRFHGDTRYDVDGGNEQETNLVLTRDLHSWEMDINYNIARGEGVEILLVFRLKAFPDIGFDAGTSYNKRKSGAQYN